MRTKGDPNPFMKKDENSIAHLIKNKELTVAEKRALVAERNPFLYLLVLGGKNASNKAVSKTK
jgi:hypothetical protein